jgi:predicted RNA-binding protein with RPS1 domain
MKIGVDLQYLNDTYSALSADMYPLNLPSVLSSAQDMNNADKILIKQLNDMLKRKALLVHVDFNKLLSSFKGYVKDIHETFTVESTVKVELEGATFKGELKDDSITDLIQKIKHIAVKSGDELDISLHTLESHYTLTGTSIYDSKYQYSIKDLKVIGKKESNTFSLSMQKIQGDNKTSVKNNLASNKMQFQVDEMTLMDNNEKTKFIQSAFAFTVGNLDMNVLKQLENAATEEESSTLIQTLISKGITMEIPNFEVKKLLYMGKILDGFSLSSSLSFNQNANLAVIQSNPFAAIDAINTKTKIVLSDALFTLIAQQPKAMMLAMIIQPKVVNGKKVYELELKNGKITVNGQSLM